MKSRPDAKRKAPAKLSEPVQVYLDRPDRDRLHRLASELGATKSDVIRQGLLALESQTKRAAATVWIDPLPIFRGGFLQPGVDLDHSAARGDSTASDDAAR